MEDGGSRWYEYFEEPDEYADGLLMVEIKVRVLKSNLFPPAGNNSWLWQMFLHKFSVLPFSSTR